MEYKIPQNIEVEDRVVGPLTLRQFIIVLIGAGLATLIYIVMPSEIKTIGFVVGAFLLATSLGIAFFNYGGQHLEQIILSAMVSYSSPRKRIWKKEALQAVSAQKKAMTAAEISEIPVVKEKIDVVQAKEKIAEIARSVDSPVVTTEEPKDPLQLPKQKNPLEALLDKAKPAQQKDPFVSQVATVEPNKQFDYPEIQIADRGPVQDFRNKTQF